MKPIDREIFEENNKLRQDPKSFIPDLTEILELFDGSNEKDMRRSEGRSILRTREGKAAVEDAIKFLEA